MGATIYTPSQIKMEALGLARSTARRHGVKIGMRRPTWTISVHNRGATLRINFLDTLGREHAASEAI